jgi:SAM-dependent methyltransferase
MSYRKTPEISDIIIQYEPNSCVRIPVRRKEALEKCTSIYARSVIKNIPFKDGIICSEAVDTLLIRAHGELQRLWEEFYHAQRVTKVLRAIVQSIRNSGIKHTLRVVDVGCGLGYVLRWLAAHNVLEEDIILVGVDFNQALIQHAQKLATIENLSVQFTVSNAFQLNEKADIFISSGVLHHFSIEELHQFYTTQAKCTPLAFAHFDPQSSWATPLGSFLFHFARMRTSLARYDGWLSAAKAHSGKVLEEAARRQTEELSLYRYHPEISWFPLLRTITGVIGIIAEAQDDFERLIDEPISQIKR